MITQLEHIFVKPQGFEKQDVLLARTYSTLHWHQAYSASYFH